MRLARLPLCVGLAILTGLAADGLRAQSTLPSLGVSGTLVDERGAPAAGVEVALRPYPSSYEVDLDLLGYDALPAAVDRTQSGPDGSFLLKAPVPGPYRFEIRPPPPTASPDAVVPLVYGNLAPLEAPRTLQANELPDRHLVAARVLDADGRPIEGALVIASPTQTRSPRYQGRDSDQQHERLYPRFQAAGTRTDEEGNARFLMPTTNANITVSASGFGADTATTEGGRAAFVLAPGPGIRFRVSGPDGAPAPGILLRTHGKTRAPLAVTNEQGEAIVGHIGGTAYEAQRWDNAFARVSQPDAAPADSAAGQRIVDLRLEASLRIPGRIADRVSGTPVAGAAIWVRSSPGENAQSSPAGEFLLNSRPREVSIPLRIVADGYLSTDVSAGIREYGVADETAVTLRPAAPLYGFVTDAADQPTAGADISAQPRGTETIASMMAIRPQSANSAADGSFRMAGIVYNKPYRLTIQAEGFASFAIDLPPYEPGATVAPLRIRLPEGLRVRGRVVDTDGNFRLAGLPHEQVELTVEADGYARFVLRGARPGIEEPIRIQLVRGASLSGRVLTATGTAAVGARVNLDPDDSTRMRGRTWYSVNATRTDGDGRFSFGHLFPGTWSAEANSGTEAARSKPLELISGSERTIELHLHAQDVVTVIVTASSGQPVTEAQIRLEPKDATQPRDYGVTDGSGRARLDVTAGPATLTVQHPEHPDDTREIVVGPGNTEMAVQLQAGGEINGFVRFANGAPASATVEAHPEEAVNTQIYLRKYVHPPTTTVSGSDGSFHLTGLEAGRYFLVARAAGHAESGPAEPIDVDGGGAAGVEIVLESGASLRGAVTGPPPTDLAQVTITATRLAQWQSATPDTEGSFTMEHLAPGTWQVFARRGDSFTARSVERAVTIEAAGAEEFVELPFERGLRLTGQVLAAGEPLVGVHLRAQHLGRETRPSIGQPGSPATTSAQKAGDSRSTSAPEPSGYGSPATATRVR